MTAETLRKWVRQAKVDAGEAGLEELHMRIAPRFARSKPRERVLAYVRGLLAPLEKKNSWTLAERAGEVIPDGMQRLLASSDWDADAVRDDVCGYVAMPGRPVRGVGGRPIPCPELCRGAHGLARTALA
jgi:hypothetical protein